MPRAQVAALQPHRLSLIINAQRQLSNWAAANHGRFWGTMFVILSLASLFSPTFGRVEDTLDWKQEENDGAV